MSEMNWKLADGLAQGTKQNDALKKALEGSGREKRRLHDRWRRVRRPAEAMLRFAYRDLGSSDFRSAVREVADFWAYNPEGWPLLRQAGQGVGGDRPTLVTVQTHLRGAIAELILGYEHEGQRHAGSWFVRASLTIGFLGHGVVVEVKPDDRRILLTALVVLGDARPWLRFCEVCGRIFFRVKRQVTCSHRCSSVLQGRRRGSVRRKGTTRGRKREPFELPVEAMHNAWLGTSSSKIGPAIDISSAARVHAKRRIRQRQSRLGSKRK